jgi:hypothetical protein
MGSNLRLATAPDVAGEHVLRRLLPREHIAEASFSTATVPLSSGKSTDGQTA